MLNSDELGEKGEHQFGQICANAKLVCNKSTRDRTGWDYIVEFNFPNDGATQSSLEKREKPLSCHVQVKTIWDHNHQIKMRLSSAEHLAKELKPAFIYVQKVNARLEFTGAHLIHILDEPLAEILKRLRKEDIAGATASNDKKVYMSASKNGVALAPTGAALRDGIIAACGSDLRAYTDKKSGQLKTLGYESRPHELNMTLSVAKIEDLVDAFLGLKEKVAAKDVKSYEVRFGLKRKIEDQSASAGVISFQPHAADTCTITSGPIRFRRLACSAVKSSFQPSRICRTSISRCSSRLSCFILPSSAQAGRFPYTRTFCRKTSRPGLPIGGSVMQ